MADHHASAFWALQPPSPPRGIVGDAGEWREVTRQLQRSSFLATQQGRGNDYYYEWGKPAPRVDGSVNYNVRDNATVFFDWTNITGAPYKQYFSSARDGAPRADYIRYIRYDESVMSVGFRVRC